MKSDEGALTRLPLSESRLLLIVSSHCLSFDRCLLLLWLIEAMHIALLVGGVKVVVLIYVHVLLNVLMSCRDWRRRLHHLALRDVLIRAHVAVAHDLTTLSKLGVLGNWRWLLVNKILRSVEAIALITRPHNKVGILHGERIYRSHIVAFTRIAFIACSRFV